MNNNNPKSMREDFHVMYELDEVMDINLDNLVFTEHVKRERMQRIEFLRHILGGDLGTAVASFRVDEEDERGDTIHTLLDSGVVVIQNYYTKRFVTLYLATPNQVKRLFGFRVPIDLWYIVTLAEHHVRKGWCGGSY